MVDWAQAPANKTSKSNIIYYNVEWGPRARGWFAKRAANTSDYGMHHTCTLGGHLIVEIIDFNRILSINRRKRIPDSFCN